MSDVTWFIDLIPPGIAGPWLEWLAPAEDTEILSLSVTNNAGSHRVFTLVIAPVGNPDPETATLAMVQATAIANSQTCICFPKFIPGGYQISAIGGLAVTGLILAIEYRPYVSSGGEPPTVFAASVNVAGDELLISFDKPILGDSGFALNATGGAVSLTPTTPGTANRRYDTSRIIAGDETLTLDYTPGDVQDYGARLLAPFTNLPVTNNSTAGGVLAMDTFTGTNGTNLTAHAMDVGTGWAQGSGSITLSGNAATGPVAEAMYWTDVGVADYTLTVTITTAPSGSSAHGAVVRATDVSNLWIVEVDVQLGAYRLYQRTAGAYTVRASAALTLAFATNYVLIVTTSGNTISATFGGGSGISYGSATQGNASTLAGIGNTYTGLFKWDNFEVMG